MEEVESCWVFVCVRIIANLLSVRRGVPAPIPIPVLVRGVADVPL